jgi:hypothetical protein
MVIQSPKRLALDAAITFSFHIGCHWRGASEAEIWVEAFPFSKL